MNKLRGIRREHNMTQAELAKAAGVSRATIVAVERYNTNPTANTLNRIAAALNCSVDDILEKTDTPRPGTGLRVNVTVLIGGRPVTIRGNGT